MLKQDANTTSGSTNFPDLLHACACYAGIVRTTVEMKPEHRNALIALAARRGEKGFSGALGEIIESYLQGEGERVKRRQTRV